MTQEQLNEHEHQTLLADRDDVEVSRVWLLADDATADALPPAIVGEAVRLILAGQGMLIAARRPEVEVDVREGLSAGPGPVHGAAGSGRTRVAMPSPRNSPHSAKERAARAVQLENDTAALHLVRQAAGIEVRAAKLAAAGNASAAAVLARATTYRAVTARLVLTKRPASLGVPGWIGEGALSEH